MVGKSNKFDYSNRSSTGEKLGNIIGSAFKKEIRKVKESIDKSQTKQRKASDGSNTKSTSIHVIEVNASNKELGDDGITAMVDGGMRESLHEGTEDAALSVEELKLQGNNLTIMSLSLLAQVIVLSKDSLKTIDLSKNEITINTDADSKIWEQFLIALRKSTALRTVDLSHNNLGPRAVEILVRIFKRRFIARDTGLLDMAASGGHWSSTPWSQENVSPMQRMFSLPEADNTAARSASDDYFKIDLSLAHTSMTDADALWLSYILIEPEIIATATRPSRYEKTFKIAWYGNQDSLGKDGIKLMEQHCPANDPAVLQALREDTTYKTHIHATRRFAPPPENDENGNNLPQSSHRRSSTRSAPELGQDKAAEKGLELTAIRHRIQRQMIQNTGIHNVELWRSAIKLVALSRCLLIIVPPPRNQSRSSSPSSSMKPSPTLSEFNSWDKPRQRNYKNQLTPAGSEVALTDVTNVKTPKVARTGKHRAAGFSDGSDVAEATKGVAAMVVKTGKQMRWLTWQNKRIQQRPYHIRETATRLPLNVVDQIAKHVIGQEIVEVMSKKQRQTAFTWGQDRATLTTERQWMKMQESAQLLTLLDKIGCASYAQN